MKYWTVIELGKKWIKTFEDFGDPWKKQWNFLLFALFNHKQKYFTDLLILLLFAYLLLVTG